MPKSMKPSSKMLWNKLRESIIDPRTPGPMAVILDSATPEYLARRAHEEINLGLLSPKSQDNHLKTAITLLSMARVLLDLEIPKPKKPKVKAAAAVQAAAMQETP